MDLKQLADEVETVSRMYAERNRFDRDATWLLLKLQEEVGELTQAFLRKTGQGRAKGLSPDELSRSFRTELADVLGHVLLLARHEGIDLQAEVEAKWLSRNPDWVRRNPALKRRPGSPSGACGLVSARAGDGSLPSEPPRMKPIGTATTVSAAARTQLSAPTTRSTMARTIATTTADQAIQALCFIRRKLHRHRAP
jgi:NTP pyrophosphatase (non-canonical NTP hydrolase)